MRLVVLVLMLLTLLLAGCAGVPAPTPATHTVMGTMTLTSDSIDISTPRDCVGTGGYGDVRRGAPVVIKDQAGTIIATGQLDAGIYDDGNPTTKVCTFSFAVAGVPDVPFYSIEVSRRGALTFSNAELVARDWTVALTLG